MFNNEYDSIEDAIEAARSRRFSLEGNEGRIVNVVYTRKRIDLLLDSGVTLQVHLRDRIVEFELRPASCFETDARNISSACDGVPYSTDHETSLNPRDLIGRSINSGWPHGGIAILSVAEGPGVMFHGAGSEPDRYLEIGLAI